MSFYHSTTLKKRCEKYEIDSLFNNQLQLNLAVPDPRVTEIQQQWISETSSKKERKEGKKGKMKERKKNRKKKRKKDRKKESKTPKSIKRSAALLPRH